MKIKKMATALIPVILFLLSVIITIVLNLSIGVTKSKYYGENNFIKFSNNTYTMENGVGLYLYDEDKKLVTLTGNEGGEIELERQSVYVLIDANGTKYISAASVIYQAIAGLCYVGACIYMCVVYKNR